MDLPPGHCSCCLLCLASFALFLYLMTPFKSQLKQYFPCEAAPDAPKDLPHAWFILYSPSWHPSNALFLCAWLLLRCEQFESRALASFIWISPATSMMPGFLNVCWEWMSEWMNEYINSLFLSQKMIPLPTRLRWCSITLWWIFSLPISFFDFGSW